MRTKKVGLDAEILAMQQIARIVRGLHIESRERVVNWAAAQPWGEELKQVPVVDPRQLTLPVAP